MLQEYEKFDNFDKFNKQPGESCEICPAIGIQEVNVCVPVEVKPFAEVSKIKTQCLGRPVIHRGTSVCNGRCGESCKFTVSQKMRIEVPMIFGAKTEVGSAAIECGGCCSEREQEIGCNHNTCKCEKCG